MEPIDRGRVAALAHQPADVLSKAIPAFGRGRTPAELVADAPRLATFNLPLLTLDAQTLQHNLDTMSSWVASTGMVLAPHGKTTMAPQLWQRQLDAGAWGITLANAAQLKVAWQFGVRTVLIANPVLDPAALKWIGHELDEYPRRLIVWADSVDAVRLMNDGLPKGRAALEVCVELGAPGGRTGARTLEDARAVAEAILSADRLNLAGVAGYEGALAHDASPYSLDTVDGYLESLRILHQSLAGRYEVSRPIVSAGGSAYFDRVAAVLGPLADVDNADVVLRSGAYLIHDDGFYDQISSLRRLPGQHRFRSAMHAWGRVLSRPEPGLALLDLGKRDVSFDEGLPVAQQIRRWSTPIPLEGSRVTAVNDQHLFLELRPDTRLAVGEIVRFGLSHPCTALDRWSVIPVLDDADADQPCVVDLIRTFF